MFKTGDLFVSKSGLIMLTCKIVMSTCKMILFLSKLLMSTCKLICQIYLCQHAR